MPNLNKKLTINFNFLLTRELDDMLIELARRHGLFKAQVIRQAVLNWHKMDTEQKPTCADGQLCRCPHAHIYATPEVTPSGLHTPFPTQPSQPGL